MSNRIKNNLKNLVGQTLNQYYSKVKPTISDLRYKQEYQNRIIECMVGEVDDNYITTPETDNPIVKLEHSKEGLVKVPSIKGKTILVDADGNETDTPAEGCRLVSVGEEDNKLIILSKNKNLLDITKDYFLSGDVKSPIIKDNQLIIESKYTCSVQYCIRLKKGVRYRLSLKKTGGTENSAIIRIGRYLPIDGNILGSTYSDEHTQDGFYSKIFTNQDDLCVISLMPNSGATYTNVILEDIQLEEIYSDGADVHYVPHKSHKTEILLDEPLRSLPNGVCDEIIGNQLIRRVGFTNLNGVKQWWHHWNEIELQNGSNDDYYVGSNDGIIKCSNNKLLKCNRLEKIGLYEPKLGYINAGGANEFGIRIPMELLEERTEVEFKRWINANNIQIMYELAEPIIEELPNPITIQGFDDTTMYIENSITPTVSYGYNALIPYKEELLNQKEEVETNTLDIENNIIPYLMDMEFNLMLMEDNE